MRGTRLDEAKIESIKKEASRGATFQELSHKYGVSWATVQYHVGKNGKKPAGGGKTARIAKRNGKTKLATNGDGHFRVEISLDGLNAIWNSLQPEKKAELLRAL